MVETSGRPLAISTVETIAGEQVNSDPNVAGPKLTHLHLWRDGRARLTPVDEMVVLEAGREGTRVTTADGPGIAWHSLDELARCLDPEVFVRVDEWTLLNRRYAAQHGGHVTPPKAGPDDR